MWISKLNVDLIDCTLSLETTRDPEVGTPAFSIAFRDVGHVTIERYHDIDPPTLGDWSAIEVLRLDSGRVRYRTDTGDAFLTFEAAADPAVTHFDGPPVSDVYLWHVR